VKFSNDSLSKVAPFRIVNIGNSKPVPLLDFISEIEIECNRKANINMMPMQAGDVPENYADNKLLFDLTGFSPNVNTREGVKNFINWFRNYYNI
jgi:UDP-glucuronate 4-epimerase